MKKLTQKVLEKQFAFALFFFLCHSSWCQNISGTVNLYTSITNISSTTVSVSNSSGFSAGDKVLLIQMKGATIDQSNTSAFGDIVSYNSAGYFEFDVIASVTGNSIELQFPLCHAYEVTGLVQLIKIPIYNNATVTGTLTCQAWNGTTGGVLVLEVTGSMVLNADIDVSGNGFRGGAITRGGFSCSNSNWFLNSSSQGGQKGESIAANITNKDGGKGKQAAGGGGGQPGNSGGGGGGNGGAGGLGGFEYSGCGATGVQAIGGLTLTNLNGRVFLGSAGGGGFSDNFQPVTPGTNGGGIIIISSNEIVGNSFTIRSNGLDQTAIARDESAGGGGAGGSILLNVPTYTGTLNVEAKGGNGGNTFNQIFTSACHGPGGGGGGGTVAISLGASPGSVNFNTIGGQSGLVQNPSSSCYNKTFGGTVGQTTISPIYNLVFPLPMIPINLGNDTSICQGAPLKLDARNNYASYLWQDGSSNQTYQVINSGNYAVTVTNSAGCIDRDTLLVSTLPSPIVKLGKDTSICQGQNLLLDAGAGFSFYNWTDGSVSQTLNAINSGTYSVTVTNSSGCSASDTIILSSFGSFSINAGNDTTVCRGQPVMLKAETGYSSYHWKDGSVNPEFIAAIAGVYSVTVTDNFGCQGTDDVTISNFPSPSVNLGKDTSFCEGDSIMLNAGTSANTYLWQDGSVGQTFITSQPGTYFVRAQNNSGCLEYDTLKILPYNPSPPSNLIESTVVCPGESTILKASRSYSIYIWNGINGGAEFTITQPGIYYLTVTNSFGCSNSDSSVVTRECKPIVYFPNAFTPNSDRANDLFTAIGKNIESYNIKIFSRWGELVFETSNINIGWNGTFKSQDCLSGVYVYVATYTGELVNGVAESGIAKGNVTLIR